MWQGIAQIVGVELEPVHEPPRAADVRHSFASIARARDQLGYVPTVNLEDGLEETIAYFRERMRLPERFRVAV